MKAYILKSPEELLELWDERRRKDAEPVDWDFEETKRKLLAFFGGEGQEPAARGDLERERG